MRTHEGTQILMAIRHLAGILKLERQKLPRSSDFDVVRDAISLGFERKRAPATSHQD
jgi:hypothetical protein